LRIENERNKGSYYPPLEGAQGEVSLTKKLKTKKERV
jgi:hypothetical protein